MIASNFTTFLTAADHPAEESKSARSARHQSIHAAARAIRAGRAADEIERPVADADLAAEERAGDGRAVFCRLDGRARRLHTQLTNQNAAWNLNASKPATATINIQDATGQTVYYRQGRGQPRRPGLQSGTASAPTAPSSPTAFTSSPRPRSTPIIRPSRSRPKFKARSTSVDLTQNPPVLSIAGQTYTLDKVKRIVAPS